MARRLLLLPAVEEQGEVYWWVLLICCKQNVNLLMATSTAARLLVMHLCSDLVPAGGEVGGRHTTCRQSSIKGDCAALSSLLTCRPWSTLRAIHNNTQAGHYTRNITDDNNNNKQNCRGQQEALRLGDGLRSKVREYWYLFAFGS